MSQQNIRVAVSGAAGRMGREVLRAVIDAEGLELVAAIDRHEVGVDSAKLAGRIPNGVVISPDLVTSVRLARPDVLVDFTLPASVLDNARVALAFGVSPVIGTTGLSEPDFRDLDERAKAAGLGIFVAPNFAIGAVLLMQFAAQASKYMPDVEIIEMHHEKKIDSPSGTALLTAQKIEAARREAGLRPTAVPCELIEKAPGARGARDEVTGDVPVHSVRLPGFVASQAVIFGGVGQTLTLRHDSLDRTSFMPGVVLAIRKIGALTGLVVGLEALL